MEVFLELGISSLEKSIVCICLYLYLVVLVIPFLLHDEHHLGLANEIIILSDSDF